MKIKKQYVLTEEEYQKLVDEKAEQRSKFDYVLNVQLEEIKKYRKEFEFILTMISNTSFTKLIFSDIKDRIQYILREKDVNEYKTFCKIIQELKDNDNKIMLKKQLKLEDRGYSPEEIEKTIQNIIESYKNL